MTDLIQLGKAAVAAKYKMQLLDTDTKNKALLQIARALVAGEAYILSENAKDIEKGEKNGMHPGMIDRLRFGKVTDMIRLDFVDFPVFNVADCFITVGCVLLLVYVLFFDRKKKDEAAG